MAFPESHFQPCCALRLLSWSQPVGAAGQGCQEHPALALAAGAVCCAPASSPGSDGLDSIRLELQCRGAAAVLQIREAELVYSCWGSAAPSAHREGEQRQGKPPPLCQCLSCPAWGCWVGVQPPGMAVKKQQVPREWHCLLAGCCPHVLAAVSMALPRAARAAGCAQIHLWAQSRHSVPGLPLKSISALLHAQLPALPGVSVGQQCRLPLCLGATLSKQILHFQECSFSFFLPFFSARGCSGFGFVIASHSKQEYQTRAGLC